MTIFKPDLPLKIKTTEKLFNVMTPESLVRFLKAGIDSVKGLVKRYQDDQWAGLGLTKAETLELETWLNDRRLLKAKKDLIRDRLPAPNPHIVPFERIMLPLGLDGREGSNRAANHARSLEATDDLSAIRSWLLARANNVNTQGVYRKEAERFLLWCTQERQIALSSVGLEEASLYLRWLEQLGRLPESLWSQQWSLPQHDWLGAKNTPRTDPQWRPFNAPLSHTSRKMALMTVRQLFNFLTKTGYIIHNPFDQITRKVPFLEGEGAPKEYADRSFSDDQWAQVSDYFINLEDDEAKARLAVILMMGKGLGLRASEMLNARAEWITERMVDGETIKVIEVIGKGDKVRRLPLQEEQVMMINHYLHWRDLPELGLVAPETPLLASLGRGAETKLAQGQGMKRGLSRSGLYRTLEMFLENCAREIETSEPMAAAKLRASSTHWLRHTFATTALKSNMPINVVQNAMGHASVATTSRYLTPEEAEVARAMKNMKVF
ncbi:MAG: site-specific integrase [Burkholderiaceae bacterium]|nr:site-specific integrase [Burkholderiaceae bacterium]